MRQILNRLLLLWVLSTLHSMASSLGYNSAYTSIDMTSYLVVTKISRDTICSAGKIPPHKPSKTDSREIKQAKAKRANSWNIEEITPTKFSKALFKLLDTHHTEIITSEKLGILQKKFQPYFSPLKQSLVYPESTFTSGVFLFKIQLVQATVWLEMDASMDFEYFADAILQAFDFENDHLYQFEYKDMSNRVQKINHYRLDVDRDEKYCEEVKLGDTDIASKSTMLFLFDFGDSWEFHITLEEIDEKRELSQPVIVKSEGTPPKQYLDDEDDDESLFM